VYVPPDAEPLVLAATLVSLVRPSGVPLGHRGEIDARGRIHCGSAFDEPLREVAVALAGAARERGFHGPCGVDAFVFERDGREWLRPHELNARFTLGLVAAGLVRRGLARLRETLGLEADRRRGFLFALNEPAIGWSDALAALPGESLHIPLASETSRVRPALVFAQDAASLDGLAREVVGLER
jgi:hypothetical protein